MRAFTGSSVSLGLVRCAVLDGGGLHAALLAVRTKRKLTFPAMHLKPVQ